MFSVGMGMTVVNHYCQLKPVPDVYSDFLQPVFSSSSSTDFSEVLDEEHHLELAVSVH